MKKSISVLLVIVMLLVLVTGCSQGSTTQTTTSSASSSETAKNEDAKKPEKLTVLIWGNVESQENYNKIIKSDFTDKFGIDVETILTPQTDFYEKLTIMIATNTAPDTTWIPDDSFPLFFTEGMLAPLDKLVSDEEYDYYDILNGQRVLYEVNGVPYAIPFSAPSLVMFYNKTLIEKAGLKTPNELYEEGQWTSDKMYEYAIKLANPAEGIYGINFTRSADWGSWDTALYPVIRSYGGEFWSADGKTFLMNSEANVKALNMYHDLMFVYNAHPKPGDSADFFAGQCALYPSLFGDCRKMVNLSFEWDCCSMPYDDKGQNIGWLATGAVGALEKGKNLDWTIELIKVLTGKTMMAKLQNTYIPPRTSLLESESFITGDNGAVPRPSYEHYKQAVLDQASKLRCKEVHLNIEKIDEVITKNLEEFYSQTVTAEECLANIEKEAKQYMNK